VLKDSAVDSSHTDHFRRRSSVILVDMQDHFFARHLQNGSPVGILKTLCEHQMSMLEWMGMLSASQRPELLVVEYYGHGRTLGCITETIRAQKLSYTLVTKWADSALVDGQSLDGRKLPELLGNPENSNGVLLSGVHSSLCVALLARGLITRGYKVLLPHKCHGDFYGRANRNRLPNAAETRARIMASTKAPAGSLHCGVTLSESLPMLAGR